jgi:hypothetical protein
MYYFRTLKLISFLILFRCLLSPSAGAQEIIPYYLLPDIPQSTLYNPAYQNKTEKLAVGIPVLSGVYGTAEMNVPFNSLFSKGFSYDLNRFYNSLDERGIARAAAGISLFFASFKHNEFTYNFSVSERSFSEGSFDREIIKIIRDGIQNYYGSYENLGDASFNFNYFREVAPGLSKQISERIDAGVRLKILFGKMFFDARDANFSVETDEDKKRINIKVDGDYKFSGPFVHKRDTVFNFSSFDVNMTPADYFFGAKNLGFAFDAGIIYRPGQFTEISVSLIDIGFTGYKNNLYDIKFFRPVRYSENSLYQSDQPGQTNYIEPREALKDFGDSISYIINVDDAVNREIVKLPFKLNVSAKYKFTGNLSSGISNQIVYYNNVLSNFLSAYATGSISKKTQIAGSLSLYDLKSLYPGIAMSTTFKRSQFFLTTNNILGIIDPTASKHVNLCFGINFLFDKQ